MVPFVILSWDVNRDFHLREMSSQEGNIIRLNIQQNNLILSHSGQVSLVSYYAVASRISGYHCLSYLLPPILDRLVWHLVML